jgi:hypothetical protein
VKRNADIPPETRQRLASFYRGVRRLRREAQWFQDPEHDADRLSLLVIDQRHRHPVLRLSEQLSKLVD